jgi:hypothetical protein
MALDEMPFCKMTVDKMTFNKASVNIMIADEMPVIK